MKIVGIIPSRYGSTRFPGKPLASIAGKPMIQHVYERASCAESIDQVYIATDNVMIYDAVRTFGGNAIMTTEDMRTGTDRVYQAANIIGLEANDIVINIQGDQPLIEPGCLDQVAEPLRADVSLGMTTLAYKIVNPDEITNPKDVKVTFDREGFALYFSRSPIPYPRDPGCVYDSWKHLGIYAYTVRFLKNFSKLPEGTLESIEKLEQLRALEFGHLILVVKTEYDSPEVDIPEDIVRIEKIITQCGQLK